MEQVKIAPSVRSVFSKDGAVLMEIQQGLMFTSNPVGGRILELLSQNIAVADIPAIIGRECGVSHDVVQQDLSEFLDQLSSYGLLQNSAVASSQMGDHA